VTYLSLRGSLHTLHTKAIAQSSKFYFPFSIKRLNRLNIGSDYALSGFEVYLRDANLAVTVVDCKPGGLEKTHFYPSNKPEELLYGSEQS